MKDDIIRWMKEFVEVPHPNFGNFAPCPYAKEARIENKIKFVETQDQTQILNHMFVI